MGEPTPTQPQTLRHLLAKVHLRLIIFAVVLAAVGLTVSGVLVMRGYAQRNLALVARSVAYTIEPAIAFQDRQAVSDGLRQVGAVPGVRAVDVIDPQGRAIAAWRGQDGPWPDWLINVGNRMVWPQPIVAEVYHGDTLVARVRITGNSGDMLRYIVFAFTIALVCIGVAVFATRILDKRLRSDVIEPLEYVAEVAHLVRSERAFEKRVPSSGIAEIDRFGQDFNALLAELQGWHEGLTSENAELQRRATHDSLTGLGNREYFEFALAGSISKARRTGTPFVLLFFDIDQFKAVNDEHGHTSGDAMLIAVGERMRGAIRDVDIAFRLGGDEFAVLLAPQPGRVHADIVVSRIRKAMISPIRLPSGLWQVASLSVGMAIYPADGEEIEELVNHADQAMYIDKRARREGITKGGASNDA
ncbi:MAG: diguanylate cyclase domain-containing protein [Novosphingobium sp.]